MAGYALVVGIAKYSNSSLSELSKTATDAAAVAEVLEKHSRYRATLLNGEVTAKQLADALRTLLLEQAVKNEALIYFTGHGITGVTGVDGLEQPRGYLAASDCNVTKAKDSGQWIVRGGGISLNSLNQLVQQSDLSNLVVIFDSCHSGEFLERGLVENAFTVFRSRQDYYLITACRRFEQSWAKKSEQHSVFTGALLAGFSPERAGDNGQVTVDRLFDFIASELSNSRQEPIRMGVGRSITLVEYPPKEAVVPTVVSEKCPYQGLRYFDESHAKFFFGRRKVIETLKQKLEQAVFVPVIGASGSGKSSVVRAGLIPWLREERKWQILEPIFPSNEPLSRLKQVFKLLVDQEEEELQQIDELMDNATDGLGAVMSHLPSSEQLLLVVDQFEEVFTLCPKGKEKQRDRFIQLLTQVAAFRDSRLAVVITIRADFVGDCLKYKSLGQLIQQQAVYMLPLTEEDLTEVIVKPAELQGYSLGEGLLDVILEDVREESECLPLLEFVLTELWQPATEQGHRLTLAQYQELGEVSGALDRRAEEIYTEISKKFGEQGQECVKRICLSLVRTGVDMKDTRQRQLKAELFALAGDKPEDQQVFGKVLERLFKGRLLVTGETSKDEIPILLSTREAKGEQAWVDLSHEALIEGWRRFAKWRQENRDLRRLIDRVKDAQREWSSHREEEREQYLMMGGLLTQVRENWQNLEPYLPLAKEFYQQSNDYEQERKNIKKQLELMTEIVQLLVAPSIHNSREFIIEVKEFKVQLDKEKQKLEELTWVGSTKESKLANMRDKVASFWENMQRFEQRMKIGKITAEWLDKNRKRLLEGIVKEVFGEVYNLIQSAKSNNLQEKNESESGKPENSTEEIRQFCKQLDDYLDWLRYSLSLGKPIDLDEVKITSTLDNKFYVAAFEFLKEECNQLYDKMAEELEPYIQYLIDRFSHSSYQETN